MTELTEKQAELCELSTTDYSDLKAFFGEKSSTATQIIERLYGNSHLLNDAGQYAYYGRVGGCLVTGNEDGAKHCA